MLKSTLCSSGLFIQTDDNKYYFKEKEALNYIIKVTEKVLTKKLEKNIKESKTSSTAKTSKNSKSTSSVNNNFNATMSISSFGTNNYFDNKNKTKKTKENSLIQNNLNKPIIPQNYNNKSIKNVKINKKNGSNSLKNCSKNDDLNSFKLAKGSLNNFYTNNVNNNIHNNVNNESMKTATTQISNFNKYGYTTHNLNVINNNASILASNLIDNKNNINDNNKNSKNIKKR